MKIKLLAVTSTAFLLISSSAFAVITLHLTFDANNLTVGSTGTFSVSGSATSNQGTSSGWATGSSNAGSLASFIPPEGFIQLKVTAFSPPAGGATYGGNPFTLNMAGRELMYLDNGMGPYNSVLIGGSATFSPSGGLFQIGNGTTDYISGRFITEYSSNLGSFSIADMNGTFGTSAGGGTANVSVTSSVLTAVPEPSTYAGIAGLAMLGFAAGRRWRKRQPAPRL